MVDGMTQQDARERAIRSFVEEQEWSYMAEMPRGIGESFGAGWDAAKREDEQRIAALVDGLERAMQLLAYGNFKNGNTDPTGTLDEGEVLAGRMYEELRALAGIEERSSAG